MLRKISCLLIITGKVLLRPPPTTCCSSAALYTYCHRQPLCLVSIGINNSSGLFSHTGLCSVICTFPPWFVEQLWQSYLENLACTRHNAVALSWLMFTSKVHCYFIYIAYKSKGLFVWGGQFQILLRILQVASTERLIWKKYVLWVRVSTHWQHSVWAGESIETF